MKIAPEKAREIFKRAVAVQKMILDAMEDLKQLRADEIEALVDDGMDRDTKKAIRADLAEIIALAKIEAKAEQERAAAKMAHRREVAEVVGVQLDMLAEDKPLWIGQDHSPPESSRVPASYAALKAMTPPPDDMPDIPPMLDRRVLAPAATGGEG